MGTTTNYSWVKPTNGADADTWGLELNTTLDDIDAQVFLAATKADTTGTGTASFAAGTFSSTLGVTGVLTATGGMVGAVTGAVTGNVTGNLTGNIVGDTSIGGTVSLTAGKALRWNADAGLSRSAAAFLLVGNGTAGDQTGSVGAAKFSTSGTANITSPGTGIMQVGTGTTTGAGGTLNAAQFNGAIGTTSQSAGAFTTLSASFLASFTGGADLVPAAVPSTTAVGYLGVPVNEQDGDYTMVMADAGKMVRHNSSSAHAYTLPPSGSVAYPVGTTIVVRNIGTGVVTITRGAGVVLWKAGSGTDANVALAQFGLATLILESSNWVIYGTGIS